MQGKNGEKGCTIHLVQVIQCQCEERKTRGKGEMGRSGIRGKGI